MVNYSPEYPYDIDVGPLFCTKANRCFLDGGNRCGEYQTGKRNKGMLEDLYRVCTETGFFFLHNTFLDNKDVETPFNHMAAIYAVESHQPGTLGISADVAVDDLGFSRPVRARNKVRNHLTHRHRHSPFVDASMPMNIRFWRLLLSDRGPLSRMP